MQCSQRMTGAGVSDATLLPGCIGNVCWGQYESGSADPFVSLAA